MGPCHRCRAPGFTVALEHLSCAQDQRISQGRQCGGCVREGWGMHNSKGRRGLMPALSRVCSRVTAGQYIFFPPITSLSRSIASVFFCFIFFLECIQMFFYTTPRTSNEHCTIPPLFVLIQCESAASRAAGMQSLHSCTTP